MGIEDDGETLTIKNHLNSFNLDKALALLNIKVEIRSESFNYDGHNLYFISIDKSTELVESEGIPYIINLNGELTEMRRKTVFLSYSHKDADLADIIEDRLEEYEDISISRDIKITQYRDNLPQFMRTIRNHDFVISIVSSEYLHSINCMYEITELMKDDNFKDRLLFIIVSHEDAKYYSDNNKYNKFEAGLYNVTNRLNYIKHLNEVNTDIEQQIIDAALPTEMLVEFVREKRKVASIIQPASIFMDELK
ncbi:toll/interleukin-1 receptor domain-containing protein, partial [Paenibacillus nuruki]|uniref:toll/interleukin-1 receptor domain-containing protein n=1 Tax=Paenibacillus nuruki TaxID=1886670 RepID=UPI001FDFFCC7